MPKLYPNIHSSTFFSPFRMFGQFGQKQYYNMGGPGGPPQRHGQNNQMPFDEQEGFFC